MLTGTLCCIKIQTSSDLFSSGLNLSFQHPQWSIFDSSLEEILCSVESRSHEVHRTYALPISACNSWLKSTFWWASSVLLAGSLSATIRITCQPGWTIIGRGQPRTKALHQFFAHNRPYYFEVHLVSGFWRGRLKVPPSKELVLTCMCICLICRRDSVSAECRWECYPLDCTERQEA